MYQTTNIDGLLELMKTLQQDKTQKKYAEELGVSPQYLNDVYNFRRDPGPKILRSLGAEPCFLVPESTINAASTLSVGGIHASSQKASEKEIPIKASRRRKR
jgi:transcriptional regulator with XRE-family HTH domain